MFCEQCTYIVDIGARNKSTDLDGHNLNDKQRAMPFYINIFIEL